MQVRLRRGDGCFRVRQLGLKASLSAFWHSRGVILPFKCEFLLQMVANPLRASTYKFQFEMTSSQAAANFQNLVCIKARN
jgi:hypothetical protein